jgi:hypothetical protein
MANVDTNAGKFTVEDTDYKANAGQDGVSIKITFKAGPGVDARKFGMVQMARSEAAGSWVYPPGTKDRGIPSGEQGAGNMIDRLGTARNPMYAANNPPAGTSKDSKNLDAGTTNAGWGEHGYHYKDGTTEKDHAATLIDAPAIPGAGANSNQRFETTCLAIEGTQNGTYYGSISWGWEKDAAGVFKKLPVTLVSAGAPSAIFQRAAEVWNSQKTGGVDNIQMPTGAAQAASEATPPNRGGTP